MREKEELQKDRVFMWQLILLAVILTVAVNVFTFLRGLQKMDEKKLELELTEMRYKATKERKEIIQLQIKNRHKVIFLEKESYY